MISKYLITFSLAGLLLGGCATNKGAAPFEVDERDSRAMEELLRVSIEARDEMRILAKTREAMASESLSQEQKEQKYYNATVVPEGFEQIADFSYVGGATKAVEALALMSGHRFSVTGRKPPVEPWVSIRIQGEPLNEALKEVGLQTGDAIRIEVHPNVIRLIYNTK